MTVLESSEFIAQYTISAREYQKAKLRMVEGDAIDALAAVRNSLESIIRKICKGYGIELKDDENKDVTTFDLINKLHEYEIITKEEASLLHKIRMLSNRGHHLEGDAAPPTLDEAQEGVRLLEEALEMLFEKADKEAPQQKVTGSNELVRNPNYYNEKRKYRGVWAYCDSREKLFSKPEYPELSQRAYEGDVSAMLDLAIGFLPKEPHWGKEQIVCMPKYWDKATNAEYYNQDCDAPDARYYYWIVRACNRAVENVRNGKDVLIEDFPKKYIPTALFEAIKFYIHWYLALANGQYVSGFRRGRYGSPDEVIFGDQFELVENIYGESFFEIQFYFEDWVNLLLSLIKEAGTCDIIDPLHQYNRTEEGIRYFLYCYCYINKKSLPENIARDVSGNEPYDGAVTIEFLERNRPANGAGDMYYLAAKAIADERIAAEKAEQRGEPQPQQEEMKQEAEPSQSKQKKKSGSSLGRMVRRILVLILIVGGIRMAFPAQWQALSNKARPVKVVDQWFGSAQTAISGYWNALVRSSFTKKVEGLLKRSNQIGAVYSKDGTYALLRYHKGNQNQNSADTIKWNGHKFPVIKFKFDYLGNSYCWVMTKKYANYLDEDAEHVERLNVSQYFENWIGANRNSTVTDVRAVWVPESAPENQHSFTHYNIHVELTDNRTGEVYWARYILEADAPSETWVPDVPNELLSLCSLKGLSAEEAATLLLGRNASKAAEAYEAEMAMRSSGKARAAEIEERIATDYYTLYFTEGADTVLLGTYLNWKNEILEGTDQWLHVLRYANIHGVLGYVASCEIWAADEGTWWEEERFVGGVVRDEAAQGLVGEGNGARVTSAKARYYDRNSTEKPRDADVAQCLLDLRLQDSRTGREYIALVYLYIRDSGKDLSKIINSIASSDEFGGIYDISDMETNQAAEYLNQILS